MGSETFLEVILAILLPPVGVFLRYGCGVEFWIDLILTLLGYIPGIIYAIYVLSAWSGFGERRKGKPAVSVRARHLQTISPSMARCSSRVRSKISFKENPDQSLESWKGTQNLEQTQDQERILHQNRRHPQSHHRGRRCHHDSHDI
ncbi:hypothetical protein VNO78_33281 [Psophocarpus tetragonolobus]|uniref:Uncharacterized protein n=1 Tax=Psophocarpus tetragonolobus TaxID=3891 RepID=A0AAN9RQL5_PSOTE